jgi:signal transduction histidine kinase
MNPVPPPEAAPVSVRGLAGRAPEAWREASIRIRIVALVLAVLLPAVAAITALLLQDLRHARESAYDTVKILSDDTLVNLDRILDGSEAILARLAARPKFQALDADACDDAALDLFAATPGVAGLELRGAHGDLICASDLPGESALARPRGSWHLDAMRAGGMTVGPPPASGRDDRTLLEFGYPVRGSHGVPRGVVVARIDLPILGAQLFAGVARGAVLSVVDAEGAVLLRSERAESLLGPGPVAGETAPGAKPGTGFLEAVGHDGVRRLFAYTTLPRLGWRIAAGLPSDEVFAAYRQRAGQVAVLGTLLLMAALAMAWRLGASITRPIARLQRTARQVADGEGHERVAEEGPPEVRAVMHDFNRMLDALAQSRDISERQRAEAALLASKTALSAALASMSEAVFICDAAGALVQTNQAFFTFHRWTGRDAGALTASGLMAAIELRSPDGSLIPGEDWPHARALRGDGGNGIELLVRRRNSSSQWAGSFNFAPLRDPEHRIFGCVVPARAATAVRRTKRELEASHAALRRLVHALDRAQEQERKRIARELHDDLQQTLAAIAMECVTAAQTLGATSTAVSSALQRIDDLAAAALQSTRRIIGDLRPQMLEELGLTAALQAMTREFSRRTGIRCRLEIAPALTHDVHISPDVATCLYRVAQEALNNVAKHAGAKTVSLRLTQTQHRQLRLQVRDDGCGMGPAARSRPSSFGVLGMHERLLAVGGHLRIDTQVGAGTLVDAEVPLSAAPPGSPSLSAP